VQKAQILIEIRGVKIMIFLFAFGCGFIAGIVFLACLSVLVAKEFDKKEKW
jgi:hypothetical protein